jgi:hypothetical protein
MSKKRKQAFSAKAAAERDRNTKDWQYRVATEKFLKAYAIKVLESEARVRAAISAGFKKLST